MTCRNGDALQTSGHGQQHVRDPHALEMKAGAHHHVLSAARRDARVRGWRAGGRDIDGNVFRRRRRSLGCQWRCAAAARDQKLRGRTKARDMESSARQAARPEGGRPDSDLSRRRCVLRVRTTADGGVKDSARGDGNRRGRCLAYRPGGRYFIYRPPLGPETPSDRQDPTPREAGGASRGLACGYISSAQSTPEAQKAPRPRGGGCPGPLLLR